VTDVNSNPETGGDEPSRRDFLYIASVGAVGVGGALTLWPFIDQMNPAADTLALSTTEVNVGALEEGAEITVMFRERPHFVRRRTATEISEAAEVEVSRLPDPLARNANLEDSAPATDQNRSAFTALIDAGVEVDESLRGSLLVSSANCTHLGCVPIGNASGDFGGWFCPCHGSHYDTAGRIRKGPAPENLWIPVAEFADETTIKLG